MALPADTSPPPAPGTPPPVPGTGRAQGTGEPEAGGQPRDQEPAQRLPGLPRLYFPDQPEQPEQPPQAPGQPYGQPSAAGGLPGHLGQPPGQPGGPQQRGRQRPARQQPTRPPERELRQRAIAALVFGALSLIALLGLGANLRRGVYLLVFSAAIGMAACVIGITALRKARKTGAYRPRGAIAGIVLGGFAALLSVPILATYLAFPTQVDNYVKCLSLAQTSSDQHACENQFFRSLHLSAAPQRTGRASGQH